MTHRHAYRRKVTPRPSDKHLRQLRAFLSKAEKMARTPCANALPFVRSAERAGRVILPVGHQGETSVFVRLIRIGKAFMRLDNDGRRDAAYGIADLAQRCREVLDAEPQPRRRDVHG
ncbi:hypothetical protein D3C72_659020 [compost metagenome]